MPVVERSGARIFYEVHGNGGPPVLFAHNILGSREVFEHAWSPLLETHRVIAVDLRGHGDSAAPEAPYTLEALVDDLLCVLDAERVRRASLVGLGLGATLAMELALRHPERVDRLVLMAASAGAEEGEGYWRGRVQAALVRTQGVRQFMLNRARPMHIGKTFAHEAPMVMASVEGRIRRMTRSAAYFAVQAWRGRQPLHDRVGAIRCPTLVVAGEEDMACPPELADELRVAIPGAQIELIARAGHTIPVEQPEAVGRVLRDFLL
jgi:3-oxoadipate enol-lactonase